MTNLKLLLIIYLLFQNCIILAHSKILTINEVLSIPVTECEIDKDCPNNSRGCLNNFCYFKYYCRNNECISSTNKAFLHTEDSNKNKKKSLISDVCTKEAISKNNCSTPKCLNNENCLSKLCLNNICMSNDEFPVIKCNNEFVNRTSIIVCKKNVFEKCETNNECHSNYCTENKFCNDVMDYSKHIKSTALFILKVSLLLCILILLLFGIVYCCDYQTEKIYYKKGTFIENEEEEEEEEEEMEEEIVKKEEEECIEILKKEKYNKNEISKDSQEYKDNKTDNKIEVEKEKELIQNEIINENFESNNNNNNNNNKIDKNENENEIKIKKNEIIMKETSENDNLKKEINNNIITENIKPEENNNEKIELCIYK